MTPKMIMFSSFCDYCCVRFSLFCGAAFGAVFHIVFCVFCPRAKKAEERNSTHSPRENLFFQGARPRRRSPKDDNRRPKKALNKASRKCEKHQNIIDFSASRGRPPKIPPKRASRAPSGDLPGTPRRLQEAPRALQDGSKSRQERSKSRPGAAPERPWRPLGAGLGPRRPPEASRRPFCPPRGSILAPPGVHFGASGEQKKRQTQEEKQEVEQSKSKRKSKSKSTQKSKRNSKSKSNSKGKTKSKTQSTSKRRATSQGQKAARPQGPGGMSGALRKKVKRTAVKQMGRRDTRSAYNYLNFPLT